MAIRPDDDMVFRQLMSCIMRNPDFGVLDMSDTSLVTTAESEGSLVL